MPFKIVHCADLHIGASFSHLPTDLAALRREEIRTAFSNIIDYCKEKSVDALLICGDLFDCPKPSKRDCDFVKNMLGSLSPVPVFIICGNHDYMCSDSPFSKANYFSENVHIFPCFDYAFELPSDNAVIYGKSYGSTITKPSFNECIFDASKINILCLHGDIIPSSDYNTISRETLASSACNYAAFGHIHNGEIFEVGTTKCAYSGTPEGHKFNDDGFTGFIYAEITPEETVLTPVSLSKRHYIGIYIDVTGKTMPQIIEEAAAMTNGADLFRLTLTGEYTEELNLPYIKSELEKKVFYIDISDNTVQCYDFDAIENEESLCGEFLRKLRSMCSSEEEFILCAKTGLDALSGKLSYTEAEI